MKILPRNARVDFRFILLVASAATLIIVYGVLWLRMISSQAERTGTDFLGFYTATRIYQSEGASNIYDAARQQSIEQTEVGFNLAPGQVLLFNHLPYFIPILSVLVSNNYVASFIRWTILLLIFLLLDAFLIVRILPKDLANQEVRLLIIGAILFFPIFTSLMNGQETVFVLLGAILWMSGILKKNDLMAGLGLSLVTIRPQLALIMAVPFLVKRRKVLAYFLLGTLPLAIFCFLFLGVEGVRNLVHFMLISAGGNAYGLHPQDMPSLSGILHRWFSSANGTWIQWVSLGAYALAALAVTIYFRKSDQIGERQVSVLVMVSLLFVPYLHYHDVAIAIVPLFCLIRILYMQGAAKGRDVVVFPFVISFILMVSFITFAIRYPFFYLVMFGIIFSIFRPFWPGKLKKGFF